MRVQCHYRERVSYILIASSLSYHLGLIAQTNSLGYELYTSCSPVHIAHEHGLYTSRPLGYIARDL